jgi:hypothetical protein
MDVPRKFKVPGVFSRYESSRHQKVLVARQSDLTLFTLGLSSSQFCSWSLFPLLSILALRRSSQIITCKIVIFLGNKFVNILNTQVLSHSARRTRLL